MSQPGVRPLEVLLSRDHLRQMVHLVRLLHRLSQLPTYHAMVDPVLPETARYHSGPSGLPMGYDFHITPQGPRLIEVNTNAGGLLLAWLAHHDGDLFDWRSQIPQKIIKDALASPLAAAFRQEARLAGVEVQRAVILDDTPEGQFLYPEMVIYQHLFQAMGWQAVIASPQELTMDANGVYWQGEAVQLIYNRHCDFYLETPAMAGLAAAWMGQKVALTPHPRVYGLLADKRRMPLWQEGSLLARCGFSAEEVAWVQQWIPASGMLENFSGDEIWQERKKWVLKPVTSFGSRGVVLGESMSRTRFNSLTPATTLVQEMVPPSLVVHGEEKLKCDWRLFAYQDRILAVAARLYKGQVTNLRSEGSGFAKVIIKGGLTAG
ncbi:MAG: hypothetical protein G8345_13670 [Magnetococcales bacterium]|nr:hypothetical protein [Magnetococcales bacterium]NGZ27923.1 hypothetical protein [Magnetococcales bacterium]